MYLIARAGLLLAGSLHALALAAGQSGATPSTISSAPDGLKPLAFLVGSCWAGPLPKEGIDTHCFSSVYDGQFVRDVHTVTKARRPYQGETLYHWDAAARVVKYTYWNSLGGVSTGTMNTDGDRLVFPETHEASDGTRIDFRNVWFQDGANAYVAQTDQREPTGWTQRFRIRYERQPAAR